MWLGVWFAPLAAVVAAAAVSSAAPSVAVAGTGSGLAGAAESALEPGIPFRAHQVPWQHNDKISTINYDCTF